MTRRLRFACWALSIAAAACGSDDSGQNGPDAPGGQTGEETIGCLPVEETELAWSERSSLGFSADELLNALGAQRQTRLTWADRSSTSLTLALAANRDATPSFQQREWVDDNSGRELALQAACEDVVSIPATLTFTTNDGAFTEAWSVELLATNATSATGFLQLDLDALAGSFVVTSVDPADFDDVLAYANLFFEGTTWTGALSGQAVETGEGPDSSSSARSFDIASY